MKRMWSRNELRKIIQETYGIDINNLIDKDGHERFVGGDISLYNDMPFTKLYGKWALSGSHLLIVLTLHMTNGAEFSYDAICKIELPQWIKDKLVVIFGSASVALNTATFYGTDLSAQYVNSYLTKSGDGTIQIYLGNITATADRTARIEYDLLID